MASGMTESNKGIFLFFSSRAWPMSDVGLAKHDTILALVFFSDVGLFLFSFFIPLHEAERSSYSSTERYRNQR